MQRFLLSRFAGRKLRFGVLTPDDIRRFVGDQLERRTTISNAVAINAALRAYLRWRATCGDAVQPSLGAIASPARWRMTLLPQSFTPEEVARVLEACGAARRWRRRCLAIVRLALDLGLRIGEIGQLRLDNIDWELGTVTLRGTSRRRQYVLPLPEATGRAGGLHPPRAPCQS